MKSGYVAPLFDVQRISKDLAPKRVSYSQWSMYESCPKHWQLQYIEKAAEYQVGIAATFGTAMHETLQEYLTILYTKSVKEANWYDFSRELVIKMRDAYVIDLEKNNGVHFSTAKEIADFCQEGIAILEWIHKRRRTYFPTKDTKLIAIELDFCQPITPERSDVYFYGLIDIILYDESTGKYKLIDLKTSIMGWNKYQKADKIKLAQLVIYKIFFSKQYNIPLDKIDIEFMVVKRKIDENSMFPQKRVQIIKPPSGSVTMKRLQKHVEQFVINSFKEDSEKNAGREYPAIAGKGAKHCKYCPFKERYDLCPKENRAKE